MFIQRRLRTSLRETMAKSQSSLNSQLYLNLKPQEIKQETNKITKSEPKILKLNLERFKTKTIQKPLKQRFEKGNKAVPAKSVPEKKGIQVQNGISVLNLSSKLQLPVQNLLKTIEKEFGLTMKQKDLINQELLVQLLLEYDRNPIVQPEIDLQKRPPPSNWSDYPVRDPIVTIMGHVDHGKTTLLDSLRKSSVVSEEHGGITQHIGAFSVKLPSERRITFLDTPGHAAFSAMRKRGANVTDIVVLVIAADDGLMPQTVEAIEHSLEAKVPMIVAVNKCDKPSINKDKVLRDLIQHSVIVESLGGDVPCVFVSGKTGQGLAELEENIIALSEVWDFRGDPNGLVEATVIESKMTPKQGNVATIIVSRGTLKQGDYILAGGAWCKVRRMADDMGNTVKSAGPSVPVEVFGWKGLPQAGDEVLQTENESTAKRVIKDRERRADINLATKMIEDMNLKSTTSEMLPVESDLEIGPKKFNVILKADVHGSLEAIESQLGAIPTHKVQLCIVSSSVGQISDSDLEFAKTANATVIAFNIPTQRSISTAAERMKIQLKCHNVIYDLLDDIKTSMAQLLEPEEVVQVAGEATIQQLFQIKTKGGIDTIAGCKVLSGKVVRNGKVRVVRNGENVYQGNIKTFKHHKKDIAEAGKGMECGIAIENFDEIQEGDLIQSLSFTYIKQKIE